MPRIEIDVSKCVGCHLCELVCSIYHFGTVNISKSGIRVVVYFTANNLDIIVKCCKQCDKPQCARVCEYDALVYKNGIVKLIVDRCTGCGDCIKACPYGSIFKHPDIKFPIKCDLCNGDPKCVKICPTGAIRYVSG